MYLSGKGLVDFAPSNGVDEGLGSGYRHLTPPE